MPFESQAQRRWMFSEKPEMAKEWASHTPKGKKLPEKVKKKAEYMDKFASIYWNSFEKSAITGAPGDMRPSDDLTMRASRAADPASGFAVRNQPAPQVSAPSLNPAAPNAAASAKGIPTPSSLETAGKPSLITEPTGAVNPAKAEALKGGIPNAKPAPNLALEKTQGIRQNLQNPTLAKAKNIAGLGQASEGAIRAPGLLQKAEGAVSKVLPNAGKALPAAGKLLRSSAGIGALIEGADIMTDPSSFSRQVDTQHANIQKGIDEGGFKGYGKALLSGMASPIRTLGVIGSGVKQLVNNGVGSGWRDEAPVAPAAPVNNAQPINNVPVATPAPAPAEPAPLTMNDEGQAYPTGQQPSLLFGNNQQPSLPQGFLPVPGINEAPAEAPAQAPVAQPAQPQAVAPQVSSGATNAADQAAAAAQRGNAAAGQGVDVSPGFQGTPKSRSSSRGSNLIQLNGE
jgi:hypothetical protein